LVKKTLVGTTTFSSLTIRSFITTILTAITYFVFGSKNIPTFGDVSTIVFAALLGYVGLCALFKAFTVTDKPSLIAGLGNSNSILVAIFGVIFFGNILSINAFIAIAVTICGLLITTINFNDFQKSSIFNKSSGVPFVFIQMIFWGVAWNIYGLMGAKVDPFLVLFIIELVNFVASLMSVIILEKRIKFPVDKALFYTLVSAVLIWVGFGSQVYAMSYSNPGLISTIVSLDSILALVFGRVFMKEKLKYQQYFGILVFFVGLVLLRVFAI
jgi:uncharacterized membrane protein